MFWVRLKDGTLERIPGDSYKESKYGHRILKGERWIAEYAREHLVALYRDPPVALRNDIIDDVTREVEEGLEELLANEFPDVDRETAREKIGPWIESFRQKMKTND